MVNLNKQASLSRAQTFHTNNYMDNGHLPSPEQEIMQLQTLCKHLNPCHRTVTLSRQCRKTVKNHKANTQYVKHIQSMTDNIWAYYSSAERLFAFMELLYIGIEFCLHHGIIDCYPVYHCKAALKQEENKGDLN